MYKVLENLILACMAKAFVKLYGNGLFILLFHYI